MNDCAPVAMRTCVLLFRGKYSRRGSCSIFNFLTNYCLVVTAFLSTQKGLVGFRGRPRGPSASTGKLWRLRCTAVGLVASGRWNWSSI